MSLNFKFGDLVILCLAHRAGAIRRKKGGRKGLVAFNKNKLKLTKRDLKLELLIPYTSLNSFGSVLKAVNEIKGHIGFICVGTGPPLIMSFTSSATSVS